MLSLEKKKHNDDVYPVRTLLNIEYHSKNNAHSLSHNDSYFNIVLYLVGMQSFTLRMKIINSFMLQKSLMGGRDNVKGSSPWPQPLKNHVYSSTYPPSA